MTIKHKPGRKPVKSKQNIKRSKRSRKKARGALFVIGGAEARGDDLSILEHFVQACGGETAGLVVISTAAAEPEAMAAKYGTAFGSIGARNITFCHQTCREDADKPELLESIERADGVFFTGGNQLKLVTAISGTKLMTRLQSLHKAGLTLGGTSAGASAMSTVMIARGIGRSSARLASIRMSPGLGFLPEIVVDQHFRERDRFGRLLAAVLCNPAMLGFGLDEDTAFVLDSHDFISVLGSGTLTIVDGSEMQASNIHSVAEDMPAAFAGMRVHVLCAGWKFDLVERRVEPIKENPENT